MTATPPVSGLTDLDTLAQYVDQSSMTAIKTALGLNPRGRVIGSIPTVVAIEYDGSDQPLLAVVATQYALAHLWVDYGFSDNKPTKFGERFQFTPWRSVTAVAVLDSSVVIATTVGSRETINLDTETPEQAYEVAAQLAGMMVGKSPEN